MRVCKADVEVMLGMRGEGRAWGWACGQACGWVCGWACGQVGGRVCGRVRVHLRNRVFLTCQRDEFEAIVTGGRLRTRACVEVVRACHFWCVVLITMRTTAAPLRERAWLVLCVRAILALHARRAQTHFGFRALCSFANVWTWSP